MYGYLHGNIPDIFSDYFQRNTDVHEHNLWNTNDVYVRYGWFDLRKFSVKIGGANLWNSLPSVHIYKKNMRQYLIDRKGCIERVVSSLPPGEAIWQHWYWTTMVQMMACCLMAPSLSWSSVDWDYPPYCHLTENMQRIWAIFFKLFYRYSSARGRWVENKSKRKPKELLREKGWLIDTWNMLNMQHIIPNSKRCDYSDIPCGGHKNIIKDPPTWFEGGHHLRKAPNPLPKVSRCFK